MADPSQRPPSQDMLKLARAAMAAAYRRVLPVHSDVGESNGSPVSAPR
jgi:hypothetical protein